jgi:hypothetical protein
MRAWTHKYLMSALTLIVSRLDLVKRFTLKLSTVFYQSNLSN